jgi:hypothetical protein
MSHDVFALHAPHSRDPAVAPLERPTVAWRPAQFDNLPYKRAREFPDPSPVNWVISEPGIRILCTGYTCIPHTKRRTPIKGQGDVAIPYQEVFFSDNMRTLRCIAELQSSFPPYASYMHERQGYLLTIRY